MTYQAQIQGLDDDTQITCDNCDWSGKFSELGEIGDAILTPGDPSPAGRCGNEDCQCRVYVDEQEDPAPKLLAALNAAWWFIENVNEDTPDRTERFFALRELVREAQGAAS
jgi:hypothetical protein